MSRSRLSELLKFHEQEPDDPFTIYALALEYSGHDATAARKYFDLLLTDHENYVPAYYHAAAFYQQLGDKRKATDIYEKGMRIATAHGDLKAARELRSAYDLLTFEDDE